VLVVATSAPAAAASIEVGGLVYNDFEAASIAHFWDATEQRDMTVTLARANLQNMPEVGGGVVSSVMQFTLTFALPVGDITAPKWGLGSNNEGIADPSRWALVSPPSVVAGIATLVVSYIGVPLATYDNVQPSAWIQSAGSNAGATASTSVVALHADSSTSSDAKAVAVVDRDSAVFTILDSGPIDWVYTPPV